MTDTPDSPIHRIAKDEILSILKDQFFKHYLAGAYDVGEPFFDKLASRLLEAMLE